MTGQIDVGWSVVPLGLQEVNEGKSRIIARARDVEEMRNQTIRVNIVNVRNPQDQARGDHQVHAGVRQVDRLGLLEPAGDRDLRQEHEGDARRSPSRAWTSSIPSRPCRWARSATSSVRSRMRWTASSSRRRRRRRISRACSTSSTSRSADRGNVKPLASLGEIDPTLRRRNRHRFRRRCLSTRLAGRARYFDWSALGLVDSLFLRRRRVLAAVSRLSVFERPYASVGVAAFGIVESRSPPRRDRALPWPRAGARRLFLSAPKSPTPRIDIPQRYRAAPRNADAALPSVVWWRGFGSKAAHRSDRGGADLQSRHRRGRRPHRAGRRAGAHRGSRRCCRWSISTAARAARASSQIAPGSGGDRRRRSERITYSTSLSASYEIDFWGKNRAALRAAEELAAASRFDREVVALTTVVTVANSYFLVLSAQDRLRTARENLAAATRVYNLVEGALQGRHRLRARHRAAGKPGQQPARRDPAARADRAGERRHACGADRPRARRT